MKTAVRLILFGFFLFRAVLLSAAMSGGAYTIYADTFSFVDTATTSGDIFSITGTGGEFAVSTTSGNTFELRGGFQAAERGILSFSVTPSAFSIGPLTDAAVSATSITLLISTDSETGYTTAMTEDGNLRSGSNEINDVSDGSVTAGSEEYGIITSGTDALISSDTAIGGTLTVASASGTVTDRQTTVTFRASVDNNTPAGTYTHVVTFTATVNP